MESEFVETRPLDIELQKLEVEKQKMRLNFISIMATLVAALLALGGSLYTQHKQSENAFELKAAEIVMNAHGPQESENRALTLSALFPDKLPKDFSKRFSSSEGMGTGALESKLELFKLLVQYPEKSQDIRKLHKEFFEGKGSYWAPY